MNTMFSQYRREVPDLVAKYRRKKASGGDIAALHEDLYSGISLAHGPVTAEFFDKEGTLPLVTSRTVPWPMTRSEYRTFALSRWSLATVAGLAGVFGLAPQMTSSALVGLALSCLLAVLAAVMFTVAVGIFKPSDIDQRHRQLTTFEKMLEAERRKSQTEAERRRAARLLREYETEGD